MEAALRWLADANTATAELLRLMDATPVPCGTSAVTAKRSDLFGHAGYAYYPSHSRWYWGAKLLIICTCDGTVTGFSLANPKLHGERDQARQLPAFPDQRSSRKIANYRQLALTIRAATVNFRSRTASERDTIPATPRNPAATRLTEAQPTAGVVAPPSSGATRQTPSPASCLAISWRAGRRTGSTGSTACPRR
jgi:hypothetical protein